MIIKVCPVVLREFEGQVQFLCFKHPYSGMQIVKGTLEEGELPCDGALRELSEESGLIAMAGKELPNLEFPEIAQKWHFFIMSVKEPPPDHWIFHTTDGGGLDFAFEWRDLYQPLKDEKDWYFTFLRALEHIKTHVNRSFP